MNERLSRPDALCRRRKDLMEVGRESACLLFIYRSVCVVFTLSPCRLQAEVCLPIEMLDKVSIDPHDDDVDVCAEIDIV